MDKVQQDYENLMQRMKAKKASGLRLVSKAFELANVLHAGQFRKTGEPYISHPLEVAILLENLDFGTNVVASALLHDIVEDCEYTIGEIKQNFNDEIAEIVDAVTAVEKESNNDDFAKLKTDSKTFQKLISFGKNNIFAFYIKFADRLCNLKTLETFSRYKQIEKIKETEQWILSVAKLLKATYFFEQLSNECFKILNIKNFYKMENTCKKYFEYNKNFNETLRQQLWLSISVFLKNNNKETQLSKIIFEHSTEVEIFNLVKRVLDVEKIDDIKSSQLVRVPITKIFLIFDTSLSKAELQNMLISMFMEGTIGQFLKITGFEKSVNFDYSFLVVSDSFKNKFQLYALSQSHYVSLRNGTLEGTNIEQIENDAEEITTEFIQVKTRNGQIIALPEGSTVLDFAFKIHKDFGFACRYAFLNDSPTKSPIYTKLSPNDKINLHIEKDENGVCKNIAELRWLLYAKTDYAKKLLVKYFESV